MTVRPDLASSLAERFGFDVVDDVHDLGDLRVVVIGTPSLGDRSYVLHDGRHAFVVDPQRDIDRVLAVVEAEGVDVAYVAETHVHNDYLTGGLALAQATGAEYLVPEGADVAFDRTPVREGTALTVGPAEVRVLATPGHTPHHVTYLAGIGDETAAAFTGGSLLYGTVGRTDLVGPRLTERLTRDQWRSARRIAAAATDSAAVFPTHGFGSMCAASPSSAETSTVGRELVENPALVKDEHEFVRDLIAGFDAYPAYYAWTGPQNAVGPGPADLSPPDEADPVDLRHRADMGDWLVDLRDRRAFQDAHMRGSLSFELAGDPIVYLAWLIPPSTPVVLLGDSREQVSRFQRDLARVGIDRPEAQAVGGPAAWASVADVSTLERATFADLADRRDGSMPSVVDVRSGSEWAASHIRGALHVPIHDLPGHLDDLPHGEAWVHCATGFRATMAASFLARAGRRVVVVDDDFERVADTGLPLSESPAA